MPQPSTFHAKQGWTSLLAEGLEDDRPWAHIAVHSPEAMAALLKQCSDAGAKLFVGRPRPLPGSLSAASIVFADVTPLNAVVEHRQADQVISLQCGMKLAQLDKLLEKSGQWWPIAGGRDDTVYDIIANGDGGWLEQGFSGPRHLILGLELALPNGNLIKTGGKVVKNVTGYDLTKLIVGGRSLFGIPTVAHLRLFARPERCACLVVKSARLQELVQHASVLLASGLPIAVLEIMQSNLLADVGLADLGVNDGSYTTIVQVFEHDPVIAEVMPQLQSLAAPHMVQSAFVVKVGSQLVDLAAPRDRIEISCALSHVEDVVEIGQRFGCTNLRLRPACGRLRFDLTPEVDVTAMRKALSKMCCERGRTMTLATTEGFVFKVRHLPDTESAASDIVAEIKKQFDPSGCLNPLASFQ
ncbi:MAG TPA: FAD-binding oxidoreductase [Planktothrix sp.]|jgi:FAD/FMN-containing dehydrogenase